MRAIVLSALAVLTVSACSGYERDITLRDLRGGREPEEFAVLPAKPLEIPSDLRALPAPTPGGGNRTDVTPLADAVAALGGNPARVTPAGAPPAADRALLSQAGRFGSDPGIRESLAADDLEFRKRKSRFTYTIVPEDQYNRAYRREALDPYRWLARYRQAGARTPAAPPTER